jgi:hypothetical protein
MGTSIPDWIIKRAGGRRRYNAERKRAQAARRIIVAGLLPDEYQADIARLLGVSRSTICRDVVANERRGLINRRDQASRLDGEQTAERQEIPTNPNYFGGVP